MRLFITSMATILGALSLSACQPAAPIDTTPIALSVEKLDAAAMDKDYVAIVALTDPYLEPVGTKSAFGPLIRRFYLTDDFSVYRHLNVITPMASAPTMTDEILGSAAVSTPQPVERLTYFLVNPEGIVTDFATGTIPANEKRCIQYDQGLISICDDLKKLTDELTYFDQSVRTSQGLPITSWNPAETGGQ